MNHTQSLPSLVVVDYATSNEACRLFGFQLCRNNPRRTVADEYFLSPSSLSSLSSLSFLLFTFLSLHFCLSTFSLPYCFSL